MKNIRHVSVLAALLAGPTLAGAASLSVTAANKLPFARPAQTLELSAAQLAPLGAKELDQIHVTDASGKELVCQAVDTDFDAYHKADIVIFQSDFAPNETKAFTVTTGKKQEYTQAEFKAFGRFARERFDDFAWENDRIAHRTYGHALETWEGEPLTSSTIDIWSKRTPRMVINEWYMLDNYHHDSGDGFDDYSAGTSRGDGGSGLWAADKLWVSRNFVDSRVLANGPIRVLFELEYAPFEVNGISVAEVKRVSLDAGQNLDHYQSFYKIYTRPNKPVAITAAIGLKKVKGEELELNATNGWLTSWQDMEQNAGKQGLAVVFDPKKFVKQADDKQNNLIVANVSDQNVADYWAGFFWDKTGQFDGIQSWKKFVDEFSQGAASPIEVTISAK